MTLPSFDTPWSREADLRPRIYVLEVRDRHPSIEVKFDDDEELLGPLFSAMLAQDATSLQILLTAGADPALEHRGLGETLYEAAEVDYCSGLMSPDTSIGG